MLWILNEHKIINNAEHEYNRYEIGKMVEAG